VNVGWDGHNLFWLIGVGQFLFWVVIIVLVVTLVRGRPPQSPRPRQPSAVAVLEERYARGEIDRDEFLERRAVLIEQSGHK